MKLKNIINKSVYSPTGYISTIYDLHKLEQFIIYNKSVLKQYKQIVVATNYSDNQFIELNNKLWKKYFPESIVLDSYLNRGHNFGTADIDNMVVDYCKENNLEWICKSDNDIIISPEILNKEIYNVDFYYLNGIGYGGMIKYEFDFNRIINEDFYPQTWFYLLNVSKIDFLNNKQYLNETYEYVQNIPNYNGKIWEYINGWSCEGFLKDCIDRNNLTKYHLIGLEKYVNLLQIIKDYNIHDSSYKNIMIEGICHFQYPEQQIIEI